MLAYELKKDVEEILKMEKGEFLTWLAFFKIVQDSKKPKQPKRGQNAGG